jgi:hypothetical protein
VWGTTGHGITHPRCWPAAPPILPSHRQNEGPPGVCTSGPPLHHRSASKGFALPPRRRRASAFARRRHHLPTNRPCRRRCQRTRARSRSELELPFPHLLSMASGFLLLRELGTTLVLGLSSLPAGLATTVETEGDEDRDQNQSFHLTPLCVWVRFCLPCSPLRAPDGVCLKQPPCHLHDSSGLSQPINYGIWT